MSSHGLGGKAESGPPNNERTAVHKPLKATTRKRLCQATESEGTIHPRDAERGGARGERAPSSDGNARAEGLGQPLVRRPSPKCGLDQPGDSRTTNKRTNTTNSQHQLSQQTEALIGSSEKLFPINQASTMGRCGCLTMSGNVSSEPTGTMAFSVSEQGSWRECGKMDVSKASTVHRLVGAAAELLHINTN